MFELIQSIRIADEHATGVAEIAADHPGLVDHFPGQPLLPATWLVELAAQIAGPLAETVVRAQQQLERSAVLAMIRDAKVLAPVALPARVELEVRIERIADGMARTRVSVRCGEITVLRAELVFAMIEAPPGTEAAVRARHEAGRALDGVVKQVWIEGTGDVSQVHVRDVAEPVAGEGEVVVAIAACSVNYADLMQRDGLYVGGPRPPFPPGAEAAGAVIACGPGVTTPAVGTRVMVTARGGLQAERAAVRATSCLAIPAALGFSEAAAFPVSFLTAYHALTTVAHAAAGEVVVIHAAGGGVGTAAVQIAKLLGLRVVATASTEDKRARVRALGADQVVGYDAFEATVRELGGAAIILESIGGEILRRSLSVLAPLGRLVVFGVSSRDPRPLDTVKLLFRSHAVLGLHLDAIFARPDLLRPSVEWLLARVADGRLAVQVGHTLPLAEVRRAHELLASRGSYGKIVLLP